MTAKYTMHRGTMVVINSEREAVTHTGNYRMLQAANDCYITYVYGLPKAHEYAAIVAVIARHEGDENTAETWQGISAQIIKERS